MISFSNLGRVGRLGNQMFQYAYLRSQAHRMGVDYICPKWIGDEIFNLNESRRIISNHCCSGSQYREAMSYSGFNKSAIEISDDTDVVGFFQTEKYFVEGTKSWFEFSSPVNSGHYADATALHLRFGDYLNLKHAFTELNVEYYQRAIELLESHKVIVFSDNLTLAEKKLSTLSVNKIHFHDNSSDVVDLNAMANCKNSVISNSTFSWWGAWLSGSNDNTVVYPKCWFNPDWYTSNHDIASKGWIAL